jgi:hypothetical protein
VRPIQLFDAPVEHMINNQGDDHVKIKVRRMCACE